MFEKDFLIRKSSVLSILFVILFGKVLLLWWISQHRYLLLGKKNRFTKSTVWEGAVS
jgi:hypothetical protein